MRNILLSVLAIALVLGMAMLTVVRTPVFIDLQDRRADLDEMERMMDETPPAAGAVVAGR